MQLRLFGHAARAFILFPLATVLSAQAGYHEGETLYCSDCHVMHPSPNEEEQAGPPGQAAFLGELLREDVNDLCLSCHDGSSRAIDVLGPNQGRNAGDVRQGGSLNRLGRSGFESTGHTLDSIAIAPGSEPPWSPELENGQGRGLNCINCHRHHGSQGGVPSYRNLRSDAGSNSPGDGLVTWNHEGPGQNDLARDVFVREDRRYDESVVDFNEPDPEDSAMGAFCAGCHGLFHGSPGRTPSIGGVRGADGFSRFLRHPDAGVNLGNGGEARSSLELFASHANRVKLMSESGSWDPPADDLTPTCISCHKAHGNGNAYGLIYRSGTGALTENGDAGGTRLEHLCGQCHRTSEV